MSNMGDMGVTIYTYMVCRHKHTHRDINMREREKKERVRERLNTSLSKQYV